nr:MAG TPA: alpha-aminoadipate carrier protein [Caudoviricetes sp.]
MTWACRTCKKNITLSNYEHCPECHETFGGTRAGDMHRTGRHGVTEGPDRRRCLTPAEMKAKGMTQARAGVWGTGYATPESFRQR